MTKNRSRCFPTTFRIHSDRQYFILVHTRSDMAPWGGIGPRSCIFVAITMKSKTSEK